MVREGIAFRCPERPCVAPNDRTTDWCAVETCQPPKIAIINMYIPPIRRGDPNDTRVQNFSPDYWPVNDHVFICADLNGHSPAWDREVEEDELGRTVGEWSDENNFMAANTGEPTRQSRAPPFTLSTPDVTLHHARWAGRVDWEPQDALSSDHRPILIDVATGKRLQRHRRRPRPSLAKADWVKYDRLIEEGIQALPPWNDNTPLKTANDDLTNVITKAAEEAIPRGARKVPKPWWNEDVDAAVRRRNRLRALARADPSQGAAWTEADREARRVLLEARQRSWRDFTNQLNLRTDARKVWGTLRALDGKPAPIRQDEELRVGSKAYSGDKRKADAFMRVYAQASHLPPRVKRDRPFRHDLTKFLKTACAGCGGRRTTCCSPFTRKELDAAIAKLAARKAPGLDLVTNELIVHLNDAGRQKLLELANMSWARGELPSIWRKAIIVPILKKGKPRDSPGSYRPVSLLSCLGKVVERLVQARLYWHLENRNLLHPAQSGFRRARCTEDQVLKVTQAVADGFQSRRRTVMALVDFRRAFDRTWRTGLLWKMAGLGLPRCLVAWVRAFLSDRQACVRLNGQLGGFRCVREGTPQGAVLSPLLFLLFINDIARDFPAGVEVTLFADDLAVFATEKTIAGAEEKVQAALDELRKWAEEWKMDVSAEKTVATIFTLDPHEARREARLFLGDSRLAHEPTPTFLGVRFDRTLSFRQHVLDLKAKMGKRSNALRAVSGKAWGANTSDLRSLYLAYIRACADYAAAGWMPGVAPANLEHLEVAQRQACRIITGCLRSTPAAALEREADLMPFAVRRKQLAAAAAERHLRDLPGDPLQPLLQEARPRRRLHRDRGWADAGLEVSAEAGLGGLLREPTLVVPSAPPWESAAEGVSIYTTTTRPTKRTDPPDKRLEAVRETLAELPPADYTIYTDGSATEGAENGGAGVVIFRGETEIRRIRTPAGRWTSSYRAELTALDSALEFLLGTDADPVLAEVRICTDSQSALTRLREGPAAQTDALADRVWRRLRGLADRGTHVTLQWVPGHAGLPGNELADEVARAAAELDQDEAPVDLKSAKSRLRRHAHGEWEERLRPTRYYEEVGPRRATPGERAGLSRQESVEAARLRTGHSTILAGYRHRIGLQAAPTCPECEQEPETMTHLLTDCPARAGLRRRVFGRDDPTLQDALGDRARLVELLRRLGRL